MSVPKNVKCGKCTGRKFNVRRAPDPKDSALVCTRCGTVTGYDHWKRTAKATASSGSTAHSDLSFTDARNAANGRHASFLGGGLPGLGRRR